MGAQILIFFVVGFFIQVDFAPHMNVLDIHTNQVAKNISEASLVIGHYEMGTSTYKDIQKLSS